MYGHEFGYIKDRMGITYEHLSMLSRSRQDDTRSERSTTYFWMIVTDNKLVPVRWVKMLRAYCTEKVFLELRSEYASLPDDQRKTPDDAVTAEKHDDHQTTTVDERPLVPHNDDDLTDERNLHTIGEDDDETHNAH